MRAPSGRNVICSVASVLTNPALQLLATPILIKGLGLTDFGIWAFINALIAMGVTSVGMSEAGTKYVALHRSRNDPSRVIKTIQTILTVYMVLGIFLTAALSFNAPWLAQHVLKLSSERIAIGTTWIHLTAAAVIIKFAYAVLEAVVRGFYRYDIESTCAMLNTVGTTIFAVICVRLGYGLNMILVGTIGFLLLCAAGLCIATRSFVGSWRFMIPAIDRSSAKEIFGFGAFTWLQAVNCIVMYQMDRVFVGTFLGAAALGYYVVCSQLVQTAHAILSRGGAFLFPLIVKYREERRRAELWILFRRGMILTTCVGWALSGGLMVFGSDFLTLWLGSDFANKAAATLQILAVWNAFLATSVVPFYFMNANGGEKVNALLGTAGAGIFIGAANFLVPIAGTVGAATAKLLSVADGIVIRTILFRREFEYRHWWSGLATMLPTSLATCVVLLVHWFCWWQSVPHWQGNIAAYGFASAACIAGCWGIYSHILRRIDLPQQATTLAPADSASSSGLIVQVLQADDDTWEV